MTGLMDQLKKQFDAVKNKLQNALTPETERRRKREAEDFSFRRIKRAEEAAAEPEPEPEGDDYYCIKKTMAGNTVKSCLPKVPDIENTIIVPNTIYPRVLLIL